MEKSLRTSWVYYTVCLVDHLEFVADIVLELLGPGAMNFSVMVWVLGIGFWEAFHFIFTERKGEPERTEKKELRKR